MRIIGRDRIAAFKIRFKDSAPSLDAWVQAMELNSFKHPMHLKQSFGTADIVKPFTVFDISGNKYRLIAVVDYQRRAVSIEEILTHKEYDKGKWKER